MGLGRKYPSSWGHRPGPPEASRLGCDWGIPTTELKGRQEGWNKDARNLPFLLLSLARRASGEASKGECRCWTVSASPYRGQSGLKE